MHKKQRLFRDDKNTLPYLTYPYLILPLRDDGARPCFACPACFNLNVYIHILFNIY